MADKDAWYISGPMTGIRNYNYPAFQIAAKTLRKHGIEVISPVELDEDFVQPGLPTMASQSEDGRNRMIEMQWPRMLGRDIGIIRDRCRGLVLLNGWEKSKGARLEVCFGLMSHLQFACIHEGELEPLSNRYVAHVLACSFE